MKKKKELFSYMFIIIGAIMASFSVALILLPNDAIDYGTAGVAIIISKLSGIQLSVCVLAVFIPMWRWHIGGSLEQMLKQFTHLDAVQLGALLKEGRLRLVIDAVNECPDKFRPSAIINIKRFLQEYPEVPAVIAARTGDE